MLNNSTSVIPAQAGIHFIHALNRHFEQSEESSFLIKLHWILHPNKPWVQHDN